MKNDTTHYWKVGLFSLFGLLLLVIAVYTLGFNQNIFRSSFVVYARFQTVSGLRQGSTIRLAGIGIGTVSRIAFEPDGTVLVKLALDTEVQTHLYRDAIATIGSNGLVGDKVLELTAGSQASGILHPNDTLQSVAPIEVEVIMESVWQSAKNAAAITSEWQTFSHRLNRENGLVSRLIRSRTFADKIERVVAQLEQSTSALAQFTPQLNNPQGWVHRALSDPTWSAHWSASLQELHTTSTALREFSTRLNESDGLVQQLIQNDTLRDSFTQTVYHIEQTAQGLHTLTQRLNQPDTVLSKLINDPQLGQSVDSTLNQLEQSIREFRTLEAAARESFLLRGYFKKKF
ncbi:MlaD family protein [Flavobacterium sp.]|jgi:phospholipid/cholesterol/gamma-HCH transport system substrate-binding protein|uniref:MlaD family protein n=1 Tax=Flavobacterium sp. TaxID=239 RepID=UPI0022C970EA|nr:MlaD family protein [Flavobacterium sp.]MCZ8145821.1 MlaD family protein [Flavobacterium sp.]MCZ8366407.1 MlaD family protein [Flavobacterium sp.]